MGQGAGRLVPPRRGVTSLALVCAGLFAATVAAEHALVTRLTPRTHTISEYANAGGAAGPLMTVGFLSWGLSLGLTATALHNARTERTAARTVAVALLAIAAAGALVTAVFPTQTVAGALPPGDERSIGGRLHDLGSGAVLLVFLPAPVAATVALRTDARLRRATLVLLAVFAGTVVAFAWFAPGADGFRQRVYLAVGLCWQVALLVRLRGPRPRRRRPARRALRPRDRAGSRTSSPRR